MHTATASLTQKNRPINDLSKLPEHKNSDTPLFPRLPRTRGRRANSLRVTACRYGQTAPADSPRVPYGSTRRTPKRRNRPTAPPRLHTGLIAGG